MGEGVRCAGRGLGQSAVIDGIAVVWGYAVRGALRLAAFYKGLQALASALRVLFGGQAWAQRSTLSRVWAGRVAHTE